MLFISILLLFGSCGNDDTSNTRIYIEGTVKTSLSQNEVELKIKNQERIISSTFLENSGKFQMSGPLFSGNSELISNQKIKSFSTNKIGLELSKDSMSIIVPSAVSYILFNEIQLVK